MRKENETLKASLEREKKRRHSKALTDFQKAKQDLETKQSTIDRYETQLRQIYGNINIQQLSNEVEFRKTPLGSCRTLVEQGGVRTEMYNLLEIYFKKVNPFLTPQEQDAFVTGICPK